MLTVLKCKCGTVTNLLSENLFASLKAPLSQAGIRARNFNFPMKHSAASARNAARGQSPVASTVALSGDSSLLRPSSPFLGVSLGLSNETTLPNNLLVSPPYQVRCGGGPRTFPGGVTKWQWKRLQDKKARERERSRLLREKEAFEERRRQLQRALHGPERPWESGRGQNHRPPTMLLSRPPDSAVNRLERLDRSEDLWNENDGPETFPQSDAPITISQPDGMKIYLRPDGRPSSRFFPPNASHSTSAYESSDNRPPWLLQEPGPPGGSDPESESERVSEPYFEVVASKDSEPDFDSVLDKYFDLDSPQTSQGTRLMNDPNSLNSSSGSGKRMFRGQRFGAGMGVGPSHISPQPASARTMSYSTRSLSKETFGSRPEQRVSSKPRGSLHRKTVADPEGDADMDVGGDARESKPKKVAKIKVENPSKAAAGADAGGSGADPSFISDVRFDSFNVSSRSLRALGEMGFEKCTIVQAETLPIILSGRDVLGKAKTGTGKTIAFLLPAIEAMLKVEQEESGGGKNGRRALGPSSIRVVVICPTRELAAQVLTEAKELLKFHPGCGAQLVIGGTRMPSEVARMDSFPCQVLVGTPGRMLDHIQSTPGMRQRLQGLQVLVMDECDHLLDMGFRKTLDGILAALPRQRQTLLFSATLSKELHSVSAIALKRDHAFIDTVGEETTQTNLQVNQESLIVPMDELFYHTYSVLKDHMLEEPNFKVLIFSNTARSTQLAAELFARLGIPTLEIHSRMTQTKRTKVSDQFRQSTGKLVMCTSDVSARGVDYPNVTFVMQLGLPSDRAQYIHRLGRTGRAGKQGKGLLVLVEWEAYFLNNLAGVPIEKAKFSRIDPFLRNEVNAAMRQVQMPLKEKMYQAWLGYYNSAKGLSFSKEKLVEKANYMATKVLLLEEPPALSRKTAGMMGLKNVAGLRLY